MSEFAAIYSDACEEYNFQKIQTVLTRQFDRILAEAYSSFDFDGKTVAIKPNLLAKRSPDACITTHPMFVKAACLYFIGKGATVVICDSPGGVYNSAVMGGIYQTCGMKQAAEESGASLNEDMGYTEVFNRSGKVSKSFHIINPLAKADFIVNLCRLKTHSLCNMSAAVKNMYGSVPGLQKAEQHARFPAQKDFAEYLLDLCLTVKPALSVVDAILAMEGNGPAGGTVKKVGLILSSASPYCLDLAASHLMGFEPKEVLTVSSAIRRGLCPEKVEELRIQGQDIEPFVSAFKRPDSSAGGLLKQLPNLFGGRVRKLLEPRPYIMKDICVGCGECARCCPQHAIELVSKKAQIRYEDCIRCYCCQELCPKKAVKIKRNPFMKL